MKQRMALGRAKSHPDPNAPPVVTTIPARSGTAFTLPTASVTVLRGKI